MRKYFYNLIHNSCGSVNVNGILLLAVMAAVVFIVLTNLWPSMQTAQGLVETTYKYVGGNSTTTTVTDVASQTSHTMFGLLLWMLPLGIGIALLIRVLKHDK
jgi:hypothetical protein